MSTPSSTQTSFNWGQYIAPAVTSLWSLFGAKKRRKQALADAKEMAALNYDYSQQGAEAAHARQIELYNMQFNNELKTSNPAFQAARLRAAGFNPAMMFSSNQSGLGVSMPNAAGGENLNARPFMPETSTADIMNMAASQALNYSMLKAQKENIEAQTEKTIAETKTKIPVEAAATEQSMRESFERIQDMQVRRDGIRLENQFNTIRNEIAEATKDSDISRIHAESIHSTKQLEYMIEEISRARRENKIGDETADVLIKQAFEELKNITIDSALKSIEILSKEENINFSIAQRTNLKDRLELDWTNMNLDAFIKERGQDSTIVGTARSMLNDVYQLFNKAKRELWKPDAKIRDLLKDPDGWTKFYDMKAFW